MCFIGPSKYTQLLHPPTCTISLSVVFLTQKPLSLSLSFIYNIVSLFQSLLGFSTHFTISCSRGLNFTHTHAKSHGASLFSRFITFELLMSNFFFSNSTQCFHFSLYIIVFCLVLSLFSYFHTANGEQTMRF